MSKYPSCKFKLGQRAFYVDRKGLKIFNVKITDIMVMMDTYRGRIKDRKFEDYTITFESAKNGRVIGEIWTYIWEKENDCLFKSRRGAKQKLASLLNNKISKLQKLKQKL